MTHFTPQTRVSKHQNYGPYLQRSRIGKRKPATLKRIDKMETPCKGTISHTETALAELRRDSAEFACEMIVNNTFDPSNKGEQASKLRLLSAKITDREKKPATLKGQLDRRDGT
ncbi:MAG: hypothetical protein OXF02_04590 [Simkaniaceae bacterium]|nr:hypothetical protein [Simkaniaceae bacterium]